MSKHHWCPLYSIIPAFAIYWLLVTWVALYVDHIVDTLRDHGITDQDAQDIIGRINTYADEITGEVGSVG